MERKCRKGQNRTKTREKGQEKRIKPQEIREKV
jgi:hypothetical protein